MVFRHHLKCIGVEWYYIRGVQNYHITFALFDSEIRSDAGVCPRSLVMSLKGTNIEVGMYCLQCKLQMFLEGLWRVVVYDDHLDWFSLENEPIVALYQQS